jgi:hypothetical protein
VERTKGEISKVSRNSLGPGSGALLASVVPNSLMAIWIIKNCGIKMN